MSTPDERVAERIGRTLDGRIAELEQERSTLLAPAARLAEIAAELAVLAPEKARIDARRPPRPPRSPLEVTPRSR